MAVQKKPIKKVAPKTTTKKVNQIKKTVKAEAKIIGKEGKELTHKVGTRWEHSGTEEKIYTILGIILLILGLYVLRQMIGGMLLIVIGILFVTGFFIKGKKK
ncbi:hypothetical protein KKG31_05125 [Patescibacteria group bacterium]|nr:hypothetical protein [Patescibacteria group bacterium]MBU1758505.1 hypothetical protein [Patescibacteria group bacterium]